MISPLVLDTSPRMPAIWRTCIQLPRAPEETIRLMVFSPVRFSIIAAATSSVALVQMSISSERRSSSSIRPMSY
ncbi:Uncharacterised protein [Mycobacteroides abscessus subsp. abscessus]|nr:Uncharacterised protein [Mycobacteroides abscessus subsp. abscessus]